MNQDSSQEETVSRNQAIRQGQVIGRFETRGLQNETLIVFPENGGT